MGLIARLLGGGRSGGGSAPRSERSDQVWVGDPRFDTWEAVRELGDLESARSWRQHLEEAGIEAVISADQPPDRFGRGDLYVCVPPGSWSEAEEFLSNLDLVDGDELDDDEDY